MHKAILFDLDGTIVNSEPLHLKSFRDCVKPLGIKISTKRWYSEFTGIGSKAIMTILFRDFRITEEIKPWTEKRKKLFQEYVLQGKLSTIKGIRQFLRKIKKKGIKTAIVSGGHNTNIETVLSTLKLREFFDIIIGSEDVENRKPHPKGFLKAAEILGVKPHECIAIEDSPAGVEAAKNAKLIVVCIKSQAPVDPNLCDYTIKDYTDFPKALIQWI